MRLCATAALASAWITAASASSLLPGAPAAKIIPFNETVQGLPIADPYRWMETMDPSYTPWLKGQAKAASDWLQALPGRGALMARIAALSNNLPKVSEVAARGAWLFVQRGDANAQTTSLMVQSGAGGQPRVLFDPASLDTQAEPGHAINFWEPSPDGSHVYIGASPGGSEEATLRLIDTATGKQLDGTVTQANFNGPINEAGGLFPQWLPDGSGFFYNRLADGAKADTPSYYLNTRLFLHKIGTPFTGDRLVLQHGAPGAPPMTDVEAPSITLQPGSRWATLTLANGVERSLRIFVAPIADILAGTQHWQPVGSREDHIEELAFQGDSLFLLLRDKSMGHVVKLGPGQTTLAQAEDVAPAGDHPLDQMVATAEGIYLIGRASNGTELRLLGKNGHVTPIGLPFAGATYVLDGIGNRDGLFLSLENYVTPRAYLLAAGGHTTDMHLGAVPPFPTSAYVMDSVTVKARDGAMIPLDIVHRRDLHRDGSHPVLLEAYGAYGFDVDPFFFPRVFALLDAGGLYATAHVRGGGELGQDWWKAGFQATKPNTWHDAIDCGEWLNQSGWTSGRRITIWGTSAGGIMAGRALTERPDLWAGAIANVGILNAMRFEFTPNGKTNVAEFGSVASPEGARSLRAMDAYLAIRDGVAYPPVLVTAGANDPRVIDWQPAKFAARLQAASIGGPVVFHTDFDQGHGIGAMRAQQDQKAADFYAFTLWAASQDHPKQ